MTIVLIIKKAQDMSDIVQNIEAIHIQWERISLNKKHQKLHKWSKLHCMLFF